MHSLKLRPREFADLEQRIKVARGLHRHRVTVSRYSHLGSPISLDPHLGAFDVLAHINLVIIPQGLHLTPNEAVVPQAPRIPLLIGPPETPTEPIFEASPLMDAPSTPMAPMAATGPHPPFRPHPNAAPEPEFDEDGAIVAGVVKRSALGPPPGTRRYEEWKRNTSW